MSMILGAETRDGGGFASVAFGDGGFSADTASV